MKRNHCQKICDKVLCQRISKETFPAKSLERGIPNKTKSKHFWQNLFDNFSTKNSLKRHLYQTNFGSNLYRKSIGRIISTTNSLKGNLYKTIFKRNPYQKIFQEKIYKTNIYRKVFTKTMSKDIFTTNYLQINSQKKSLSNKTWKKHIIQTKTLKRKYVPKILEEKSLPKIHCREMRAENLRRVIPVQTRIEEKLLPKTSEENVFTKKFLKRNHYQKICDKVLCQGLPKETFPAKSLRASLAEDFFRYFLVVISFPVFWYLCSLQSFV